jgi:3-hydroxyacyl-[acyl-carrier-protein] dehydratase
MPESLDIKAILELLPHRYPFLLIDRVLELGEGQVVAIKNVTFNEPFFAGHFPGHPVMPGVLIVEAMAQAGAVMAMRQTNFDPARQVVYFMAIDKVKFRRPVVPGDQLRLEVEPLRKGGAIWKMKGRALVDGVVACEAEFLASMVDRNDGGGGGAEAAGSPAGEAPAG